MSNLSNKDVYDSIDKMSLKDTDILVIKINTYAESEADIDVVKSSIIELTNFLKESNIKNPIIVLGPDADLTCVSEETLSELGYYKKDIPTENIDEYYE